MFLYVGCFMACDTVGGMAGRSNGKTDVAAVVRAIESQMAGGLVRAGDFLPSIRSVSSDLGCAPLTVHRAMQQLARRGLVAAVPRQGYRVVAGARRPLSGRMVVFLEDSENYEEFLGHIYKVQLRTLQREAMRRNWTFVLVPYQRQSVASIGAQLHKIGATGIILQDIGHRFPAGLTEDICGLGLPIVNLNTPDSEFCFMDHVLRDELHGAALATEHLIRRGHRRIGWFGGLRASVESRRRFSGATEVLLREGLEIDAQALCSLDGTNADDAARPFLTQEEPAVGRAGALGHRRNIPGPGGSGVGADTGAGSGHCRLVPRGKLRDRLCLPLPGTRE
jgi:DNA-binding LacI/PurR family transcriptional regulator